MCQRKMFMAMAFLALVGLVALAAGMNAGQPHHADADKAAKACSDCQTHCAKGLRHCIHQLAQGKKEYEKCAEMCLDCMTACSATASCCHGPTAKTACASCAKICDQCAAECEKLSADKQMQTCAKSCRDCADACRHLAK